MTCASLEGTVQSLELIRRNCSVSPQKHASFRLFPHRCGGLCKELRSNVAIISKLHFDIFVCIGQTQIIQFRIFPRSFTSQKIKNKE